jgi:benzoate-CoA ligase
MTDDATGSLPTYNAAHDLLGRHHALGTLDRVAVVDRSGEHTYAALEQRANRFANLLVQSGVQAEQRVLLCLADSVDFATCFLGAIKAGAVPVPVNTLLKSGDYAYMLADSRARALVVSAEWFHNFAGLTSATPHLRTVLVSGAGPNGVRRLDGALAEMPDAFEPAATRADEVAFWLYTSGTTGRPKGVMHRHTALAATADHFAKHVLDLTPDDTVFSPPKLFFAYGLGNSLTFPCAAGATALLYPSRPTPEAVEEVTRDHPPTVFFGVPTLYAMMLAAKKYPRLDRLRICVSAGEALPAQLLQRWRSATGVDILDGLGSTELLNTFLSNRADDNKPGTSGKPVPGYRLRLVAENGQEALDGEMGDLYVSGPSSAAGYWNMREQTADTFQGRWVYTRDKYIRDADGYYTHCGRSDDMLKVGGIYVAPAEVESALAQHPAVAEAAVVGCEDHDGLIKPKAFVVPKAGAEASADLEHQLIEFVRDELAAYKRPRWIEFVRELPKTATGKIQRHKLRA